MIRRIGAVIVVLGWLMVGFDCWTHAPTANRVTTLAFICMGGFLYLGNLIDRNKPA
jgi:hypothetical protein